MKNIISILLVISLFLVQCENSTDPISDLDFSEMEIHYSKIGGWINSSILNIYGNGFINAYEISQGNDTLKSSSKILNENEQKNIANLFNSFSTYEAYYEPENYVTDQNYHRIILIYKSESDTVSVYMLEESALPNGLRIILNDIENMWEEVIDLNNN